MYLVSKKVVYKKGNIALTEIVYCHKNEKITRVSLSLGKSAVLIIPINSKNEFYLTKQKAQENGKTVLQFPSGGVEKGEVPAEAAVRELSEELGLVGDLIFLGKLRPFFTLVDLEVSVFLCKDVVKQVRNRKLKQKFYEKIDRVLLTERKLSNLIKTGVIRDAYTLSALSILRAYQEEG